MEEIRRRIGEYAEENGIIWGITGCDDMGWLSGLFEKTQTPFVSRDARLRLTPRLVLNDCRSIVVVGVGYGRRYVGETDERLRGIQSVLCATLDYHGRVRSILEGLMASLRQMAPGLACAMQVDTGPLAERELARRAGVGFYGRSHQLISQKFGTYFNIGLLLLNVELEPDIPQVLDYSRCGSCRACIDSCPGEALRPNAPLDWERCASYLTQKKGELAPEEAVIVGRHIYGCDTCQEVCPYNRRPYRTFPEFEDIEKVRPDLHALLAMDKRAFQERYHDNVAAWRGRTVIQRNAKIALSNLLSL